MILEALKEEYEKLKRPVLQNELYQNIISHGILTDLPVTAYFIYFFILNLGELFK